MADHMWIFKNASILDVDAGELRAGAVLVEGRYIKEVTEEPIRAYSANVFDVKGKVLMPGLCDAHVHVTAASSHPGDWRKWSPYYVAARAGDIMRGMLMRGFTTVRDTGGADFGLAQAVDEGFILGPRLLFCGNALSQTGGHGDMREAGENFEPCVGCAGWTLGRVCDGVPAVRYACRDEIRKGASHIKIMASGGIVSPTDRISSTQFSSEEICAAVQEAEAAGIYVCAHADIAQAVKRALRCGVRSIEHGSLIDEECIDLLLEKEAFLVPTISTYYMLSTEGAQAGLTASLSARVKEILEIGMRWFERASQKGVTMPLGSDLLGHMHRHQLLELGLRREFESSSDVIRAATTHAAKLFGRIGEIGVIAPGALADILVIDGNPLDDIGALQNPTRYLKLIMKDGDIVKNELHET